jgi:predicted nucleic acid-binding protein
VILVDSSVWIDHLHRADAGLVALLEGNEVAIHPMVIGELALGTIVGRDAILDLLGALPPVVEASHTEVLGFVSDRRLQGRGLSFVDAHLLAAVVFSAGARLWTGDRRLQEAAGELGLDWRP